VTELAAHSASLVAQLSKQQLHFVLTPKRLFDVQHGIKLGSIRTQDMSPYSWDSASHAWTNIKNHVRIYGNMIEVQRGQHMIASPLACVAQTL